MGRVRPYRRRDGTRVRGHYRRTRRSTIRFSRAGPGTGGGRLAGALLIGSSGLIVALAVVQFVRRHPGWAAVLATALTAAAVLVARRALRLRTERRARAAQLARQIAATDAMTGPQFEHWVAGVLTRSGCTGVRICGGAGDRGADVVGHAPDGRRVVIQCKRRAWHNPVGSDAIQRFAGTCRAVHAGEICMIITNGRFSNGDGVHLARELDIVLVDRDRLARWAAFGSPPVPLDAVTPGPPP